MHALCKQEETKDPPAFPCAWATQIKTCAAPGADSMSSSNQDCVWPPVIVLIWNVWSPAGGQLQLPRLSAPESPSDLQHLRNITLLQVSPLSAQRHSLHCDLASFLTMIELVTPCLALTGCTVSNYTHIPWLSDAWVQKAQGYCPAALV